MMSQLKIKYHRHSAEVLTIDHEVMLWKLGIMNMSDSLGLSRAVYFYFCKAFGVYSRHAIRDVIREQFRLGEDDMGKFVEFVDFEKLDRDEQGSNVVQPTRRVVHYDDPANTYSVYKIMAMYMKYIPAVGEFFRKPLQPSADSQDTILFSSRPIGINLLSHYLSDMMKAAGFVKEHFTTQSIKTAVVSIMFRMGIDEDISRQRTRWWGPNGRVGTVGYSLAEGAASLAGQGTGLSSQSDREKLVHISRLLDPPPFTPLDETTQEAALRDMREMQRLTYITEHRTAPDDDAAPNSPSTSRSDVSTPIQILSPVSLLENRPSQQRQQERTVGQHASDTLRWVSEECTFVTESDTDEQLLYHRPKRSRLASPPKSPERQGTSSSRQEFVAMSSPTADGTAIPKLIIKSHIVKVEPDDSEDCVVVSSIGERPFGVPEQQASCSAPTKRSATSSTTSSSRQDANGSGHGKHRPGVKNQMQCLTSSEMKEATSRPPEEGCSTLSLAFKFAYEIDHNGEVAANREVRALHTTSTNETSVKRRLLPMNVVDSSGQEATERQEEFPNFSIRLSDFFPSISNQKMDIRDVVIRGTRAQGTDRLNVELVVAENASEREVIAEHF